MSRRLLYLTSCILVATAAMGGCASWNKTSSQTAAKVPHHDDELITGQVDQFRKKRDLNDSMSSPRSATRDYAADSPMAHGAAGKNEFLLGRKAENAGQLRTAQQHYQNVIRISPQHAHAHHRLGVVADKLQQYPSAKRHYQTALNYLAPENYHEISIVMSDMGYSLLLQGDFVNSEQALNDALKYNQNSRIAMRNLGLLYGYRGDYDRAYQSFAQAGGEAEAQAQLNELFPQWRNNPPQNLAGQPGLANQASPSNRVDTKAFPNPAVASDATPSPISQASADSLKIVQEGKNLPQAGGKYASHAPQLSSQQQPNSRTAQGQAESFPSQAEQLGNQFPTSAQLSVQPDLSQSPLNSEPVQVMHEQVTSAPPSNTTGQFPDSRQQFTQSDKSIKAPPPARHLFSEADQQGTQPASENVATAEFTNSEPVTSSRNDFLNQQPQNPPVQIDMAAAALPSSVQGESTQAVTGLTAQQTALLWGGAVGPGFMFPTTHMNTANPASTRVAPSPQANEIHSHGIQQISAEVQSAVQAVDPIDQFDADMELRQRNIKEQLQLQQMLDSRSIPPRQGR